MKRLGIYFFYDADGHMREYNFVYIKSILEITDRLIVVSNGDIDEASKKKLSKFKLDYWPRENEGYDVGAYKYVLNKIGWNELNKWDELLICNYTCYGPVYPLNEMMDEMQSRKCDFWGAAMHPEQPVYLLPNKEGYIFRHIMSYFLVIRNRMFSSKHFRWFWETLPDIKSKNESVGVFETQFTKHFEDLGFASDSYVDISKYQERCYNSSIFLANDFLITSRCPFIKRRAFFFPDYDGLLNYSDTHESMQLLNYIDSYTDYDVDLIWDDLLSTQKLSVLVNNLHLGKVIDDKHIDFDNHSKSIVAIYLSSITSFNVLFKYIIKDDSIDYYLYVQSSIHDAILARLSDYKNVFIQVYEKSRNVTVDILTDLLRVENDYCYFCLITNFNIPDNSLSISDEDYAEYIFSNMIGSYGVFSYVKQRFDEDKRLGCIVPREKCFSKCYAYHIQRLKNGMLERFQKVYYDLNLTVPFDDELYTNGGGVFWLNRKSIIILSEYLSEYKSILSRECFDFFVPMLVQEKGNYTETLVTTENARVLLDVDQWNRHRLIDFIDEKYKVYPWDARSIRNASKIEYRSTVREKTRAELLDTHFSFREIIKLIFKYPAHKLEHIKQCRNKKKICLRDNARIYVKGLFFDGARITLCIFSNIHNIKTPYILVGEKKIYPISGLDPEKDMIHKYMLEYYEFQEMFFEIPLYDTDLTIEFYTNDKHSALKWANGTNYNSFDLHKKGFYSRINESGDIKIEHKKQYTRNVLKSRYYSLKDKLLYVLLLVNPFHNVTLIGENLGAGDNSFQIYKYCIENKHKNVYYLCSDKIKSEENIKALKKHMLVFNGAKHHFLQAFVNKWVGSYSFQLELLTTTSAYKDIHFNLIPGKWFFVPHGITAGDKEVAMLYHYNWGNPECTFVNSLIERDVFADKYKFNNVIYCGSPRMDKWWNGETDENHLIVFFTWRMGLSKGRIKKDDIRNNYYINSIVELIEILKREKPNAFIHYVFHHEVVKAGMDEVIKDKLGDSCEYIYFNSVKGVGDFNHWFAKAKYLITDFSSVAYDFSYKDDSIVICYIPDEFIANHYSVNQRFYEVQPGRIAKNESDLINALNNPKLTKKEIDKRNQFFGHKDGENTKRVYNAIFDETYLNGCDIKNPIHDELKCDTPKDFKRLSIFMIWDPDGIIDDYIITYLRGIRKVCSKSCVVVNGFVNKKGLKSLRSVADDVLVRENIGFDSWAYKHALEFYDYDLIAKEYDEVVLNNYTCFGPLYSFTEMFDEMKTRKCDFWGHVRYVPVPGQKKDGLPMPEHLQSHFLVFRKTILQSDSFKNYWITLKLPKSYSDAILYHELRCTDYFEKRGFLSDSFIKEYSLPHYSFNAPVYMAYTLVADHRSPLIKRKIFYIKDGEFEFPLHSSENVYDLLKYIKSNTSYDVKLIYANISRFMEVNKDTNEDQLLEIENKIDGLKEKNAEEYLVYRERNKVFDSSKFVEIFS